MLCIYIYIYFALGLTIKIGYTIDVLKYLEISYEHLQNSDGIIKTLHLDSRHYKHEGSRVLCLITVKLR